MLYIHSSLTYWGHGILVPQHPVAVAPAVRLPWNQARVMYDLEPAKLVVSGRVGRSLGTSHCGTFKNHCYILSFSPGNGQAEDIRSSHQHQPAVLPLEKNSLQKR